MSGYTPTSDALAAWIFDGALKLNGEPVEGWSRAGRAVILVAGESDEAAEPREAERWSHALVAVTHRGSLPTADELVDAAVVLLRERLPGEAVAPLAEMYRARVAFALVTQDGDTLAHALSAVVEAYQ